MRFDRDVSQILEVPFILGTLDRLETYLMKIRLSLYRNDGRLMLSNFDLNFYIILIQQIVWKKSLLV